MEQTCDKSWVIERSSQGTQSKCENYSKNSEIAYRADLFKLNKITDEDQLINQRFTGKAKWSQRCLPTKQYWGTCNFEME